MFLHIVYALNSSAKLSNPLLINEILGQIQDLRQGDMKAPNDNMFECFNAEPLFTNIYSNLYLCTTPL